MKDKMNVISLKTFLLTFVIWFTLIPLTEIAFNNITSIIGFTSINEYVSNNVSSEQKMEYKNTDLLKESEDIREIIISEYNSNPSLSSLLSIETIQEMDVYSYIDVLGFLFVDNYNIDIFYDSEGSYDALTSDGEKLKNIIKQESLFYEYIEKISGGVFSNGRVSVNEEFFRTEIDNKNLVELIKSVSYKKYLEDMSYVYGYGFITLFLAVFTFSSWFLEFRYLLKNKKTFTTGDHISAADLISAKNNISDMHIFKVQPYCSLSIVVGVCLLLSILGFLSGALELYFSSFESIKEVKLFHNFFTPFNYIASGFGSLYIDNVPLSRFLLLLIMPLALAIYMLVFSSVSKIMDTYSIIVN